MSSDSDDIDEDELLQIALKEQSQRDLNYHKPPPSSSSSSKTKTKPLVQPRKPSTKMQQIDDDDSEVELLSISSGDDDSSSNKDRRQPTGKKREDVRSWDGSEPDCWKHVDEAELGRRVREMRETRAVPLVQQLEPKGVPVARKGLTNLISFPRGMECVDPLGLGIIDNKSLRLITESSESSLAKLDKESLDNSIREKLVFVSEKFDPKLFLSRIHQNTCAADLEAGALALKTDLKGRTQQKKRLVKENFDCFVSCKTTIDDIESKLKRIEEDPEGAGTAHLYNSIQSVSSLANRAFEPLFERQAQAEKIRSVQGMLQRFRTLFNLPSAIRGNISKGEYDLAVREYMKAKSIVLPSHVGILKRVLEEVEKVMHEFKGMLYKSMEDPEIDLADLENTVRLLLELEPGSDPVWHYLSIQIPSLSSNLPFLEQNHRIRGLLSKDAQWIMKRMEALHNKILGKLLDARWRQIQQDSNGSSDVDYSFSGDSHFPVDRQPVDLNGEEVDALRGRYIRKVNICTYPSYTSLLEGCPFCVQWEVCQGKSSQVAAEANVKAAVNKTDEKVGDVKYSNHSLDEVAGMIRTTISAYEAKAKTNILRPYMNDAIEEISRACHAIEGKESAPPSAVRNLRTLHFEITKMYILRLCSWMRATTEEISNDESWIPVSILERNRSPYTISILPLEFRTMMISATDQINLMVQTLRSEAAKSEDMFIQLQEIQESIRLAFLNCFLDFAGYLELKLVVNLVRINRTKDISSLQNGHSEEPEGNTCGLHPGSVISDPHQKLLIVLSNIGYCKDELSYELYNKYKHIWMQSRVKDEDDTDIRDLVMSFLALEEKVLAQYTFAKANVIRVAAVNYLLDAGIQWGGAPSVKVFSGAKPLLDKTLGILVEGLIDTFLSLFHENEAKNLKSLDPNGFCQLMLEVKLCYALRLSSLEYFETILNPYFTPDASESLKSLQAVLLEKACENVTEISENPGHHRRPTRGSEEAVADDRHQGMSVSPDDLIALAQQYSTELLQAELERTRINTACFVESIPLDSVPEPVKSAYSNFRGTMDSPSFRGSQPVGSPGFSRQRRR
ncbi:hypothetical protein IFM89_020498 [Coptis chinensis]|uniref:Exocyst complex component SEC5 n=1 Tax=Coptis chinensis TaxID=261450 RepID=A0A835LQX2_9MAGN|nr:hypothetical protein IFM89_020498 [Coptis chinensis]